MKKILNKSVIAAIATIYIAQATLATPALCEERNAEVVEIIKQLHMDDNLKFIAFAAASNTETYRMVALNKGGAVAHRMLVEQIAIVVPRYLERWDQNLAASYLEYFTTDELKSILKEKKASPYYQKFISAGPKVGQSMQNRSNELAKQIIVEIITPLFQEITPK